MSESAFRRRVAPAVPLVIEFEDERGVFLKTFKIAFTFNTLALIAESTGLKALTFELWTQVDARVMRAMLWAALQVYHPEFAKPGAIEDVGGMIDGENQERAIVALWDAYLLYLPKDQANFLRQKRAEAEAEMAAGNPTPPPETTSVPAEIELQKPAEISLPIGLDSGASPDTISDSTIARSAS